jgi:hypothetical protein
MIKIEYVLTYKLISKFKNPIQESNSRIQMSKNICSCGNNAEYIDNNKILYCSEHKHELVFVLPNTCLYENCSNIPLFGIDGFPTHCSEHKDIDYISNDIYCRKNNLYNKNLSEKKIDIYCKNRCNYIGCKKRKSFGYSEPLFCFEHKYYLMTNMISKRCLMCSKYPIFGIDSPLYCREHKQDNMVNLIHKLCACGKRANYNYFTESYAAFCSKHKKENMINFNKFKRISF